jgi:hypothetical protein
MKTLEDQLTKITHIVYMLDNPTFSQEAINFVLNYESFACTCKKENFITELRRDGFAPVMTGSYDDCLKLYELLKTHGFDAELSTLDAKHNWDSLVQDAREGFCWYHSPQWNEGDSVCCLETSLVNDESDWNVFFDLLEYDQNFTNIMGGLSSGKPFRFAYGTHKSCRRLKMHLEARGLLVKMHHLDEEEYPDIYQFCEIEEEPQNSCNIDLNELDNWLLNEEPHDGSDNV